MKIIYGLILSWLITPQIYSQVKTDSLKIYNLGEIIVTSQQSNIIKSSSVFDIYLDRIESTGGTDLSKAVANNPGVYVSTSSKNESKIYLRGFDQREIAIFIDGVPIYQPYDGLVDLSNIPINAIEKITISKGMPSLLYGTNSMGGTINLLSKTSDRPLEVDVNLEYGFGNKESVGLNGIIDKIFYSLNGTFSKSGGFDLPKTFSSAKNENGGERKNSQFENRGGMLKLGVTDFLNIDLAYTLMLIDNEKGIPTDIYTSKPRYWRFSDWKKSINNLMFKTTVEKDFEIKGNLFFEQFKNILDSYDDANFKTQLKPYAFRSTYDDHSLGINLSSSFNIEQAGLTRLSLSYRKDVHKEEGNFNQGFKEYEADNLSLAAEQDLQIGNNLFIVAGAGINFLKPVYANGGELRSSTSIFNENFGVNYKPNEMISVHANLASKSRFPNLKEFYSETIGRYVSNLYLKPEQSLNAEIGISCIYSKQNNIGLTVFYSDIKNLIQEVSVNDGLKQFQNIGKAVLSGFEFTADYQIENFIINFSYTFLSAKDRSDKAASDILEYRPEQLISLIPSYSFKSGLNLVSEISYTGKEYGVNLDTGAFVPMPDYLLISFKAAQKIFENYTLYLRINNVLDKYYEADYGYPQAGREFLFGINIKW
ncbi:MAG: TonB-dependent receptor [Ignavibacteriales bacterium]|nr:TonB-dependent receptor [Ignavibacteriales bacterium]